MKKIILLIAILLSINIYAQEDVVKKTILINKNTILNGGDYTLVNQTPGYITKILSVEVKYDFISIAYTVNNSDSWGIKSQFPDGEDFIVIFDDSILEQTSKYIAYAEDSNSYSIYGNSLILNIPSDKFTLGDSDIYITIKYTLIR